MIVQTNFIKKLKDFGLNSYEAKIWTALLSRGVSSAGELSDIANVPRSRAYDILESLEKKGFIMMKLGKPIKYIAIPPTEVIERVKKRVKDDLTNQEKNLEELKKSEILTELTSLHTKGIEMVDPTDVSGALRSRDSIYNHMDYLIGNAENEIVIITSAEGLKRKHSSFAKSLKKAKDRGVSIRIAAPLGKDADAMVKELKNFAELKHVDAVDARFCLIDKKQLLFMLTDDKDIHPSYDYGIWVNTPYFAKAMHGMFDNIWKNGKKV